MTNFPFWYHWKVIVRHIKPFESNCLQCTVSQGRNSRRQTLHEVFHNTGGLQKVAFKVHTITPRTKNGTLMVLAVGNVFSNLSRAKSVSDERVDTKAWNHIKEWVSVFGRKRSLLSDKSPNLDGDVAKNSTGVLGSSEIHAYAFHL